jgi:hypothetical protein
MVVVAWLEGIWDFLLWCERVMIGSLVGPNARVGDWAQFWERVHGRIQSGPLGSPSLAL